jgi:hypothetical protein
MTGLRGLTGPGAVRFPMLGLMLLVALTHGLSRLRETRGFDWTDSIAVRAAVVTGCIVGIVTFWGEAQDFIYFQF